MKENDVFSSLSMTGNTLAIINVQNWRKKNYLKGSSAFALSLWLNSKTAFVQNGNGNLWTESK